MSQNEGLDSNSKSFVLSIVESLMECYNDVSIEAINTFYKITIHLNFKRIFLRFYKNNDDLFLTIEIKENSASKVVFDSIMERYDKEYWVNTIRFLISKYDEDRSQSPNKEIDLKQLLMKCETIIKITYPSLEKRPTNGLDYYHVGNTYLFYITRYKDAFILFDGIDVTYHFIKLDNYEEVCKELPKWIDTMFRHLEAKRYKYRDIGFKISNSIIYKEKPTGELIYVIDFIKTNLIKNNRNDMYAYTIDKLSNITVTDAIIGFEYYVATKVLDKIKEYENIYKTAIITNQTLVVESIFKMLDNDSVNLGLIEGVNTVFSLIPQVAVAAVIEDLYAVLQ